MQIYGRIDNFTVVFWVLYEKVFQNPEIFPTQGSLSPEQSTLVYLPLVRSPEFCYHMTIPLICYKV
jgi:hypothetical protein